MTTSPLSIANRKGYQAIQMTPQGRLIVSICPTRLEAIAEVLKELANIK